MYKDFWNNTNRFDNSDYPENTPYFDKRNKEVIGILKDEAGGIPSNEFVGLRSEMYSYINHLLCHFRGEQLLLTLLKMNNVTFG